MSSDDRTINRPRAEFASTQWSLVLEAQHRSSPAGKQAFERLCEAYWYPLYAFARQRGSSEHVAQDFIQGFFVQLMDKSSLEAADPKRGRFRTFLLASFKNYVANEHKKQQTQKRGGDRIHLSLQFDDAERRFREEPADKQSPESRFERQWARTLLCHVLSQLREEYAKQEKEKLFVELQQYITPTHSEKYSVVADRLGISEGATKIAVHRLRNRYRELLRQAIADTLSSHTEVDDEIRKLFDTFSR